MVAEPVVVIVVNIVVVVVVEVGEGVGVVAVGVAEVDVAAQRPESAVRVAVDRPGVDRVPRQVARRAVLPVLGGVKI